MIDKFIGRILALDLATDTGWAFGRPGEAPQFGSLRFGKKHSTAAEVYREMRAWLNERIISKTGPDLIVYESAGSALLMFQGRTRIETTRLLIGMAEHVEELCFGRVELREAKTKEVRDHFIGHNPKREIAKREVVEACKQRGWRVDDDNQGDACALWDYQVCCLRPDIAVRSTPLFRRPATDLDF